MIPAFGSPCTVRVHRSGGRDGSGNVRPATTHEIGGCWWGRMTTDTQDAGDAITTSVKLGGPARADLSDTDSIEILTGMPGMGGRWHVDGEIHRVHSPFTGWEPGFTCEIVRGERK